MMCHKMLAKVYIVYWTHKYVTTAPENTDYLHA